MKKGESINKQIVELNRSNVSPEFITVYLSGNVEQSGRQPINQGSSLLQAIPLHQFGFLPLQDRI